VSTSTRDLRALPKGHLHLHLEAAQRPSTLRELLERYALETPPPGDGTFAGFSQIANVVFRALHQPSDYVRLLREVAEDAAAEGAVWIEPAVWITQATADRIGLSNPEAVLELLLIPLALYGFYRLVWDALEAYARRRAQQGTRPPLCRRS